MDQLETRGHRLFCPDVRPEGRSVCEQTLGWQLHIAALVANGGTTFGEFKLKEAGYSVLCIRHSGFAVLHICLSYIELIGSLLATGRQSPTETFATGVRAVPGLIDSSTASAAVLARLYDGARCGLYHEGRVRPGVGLGQPPDGNAMAYDSRSDMIGISPERLPLVLKAHLEQFRSELLTPGTRSFGIGSPFGSTAVSRGVTVPASRPTRSWSSALDRTIWAGQRYAED